MYLELSHLSKQFGRANTWCRTCPSAWTRAELLCILGSSGCGKTTTLNMIGGFLSPGRRAECSWTGRISPRIPPERRPVTTVFQSYGLFPHMTVLQNVIYGLKFRAYSPQRGPGEGPSVPGVWWALPSTPGTRTSARSAAASSSGWPWPGPSSWSPSSACWTSRFSNLDAALRVRMRGELEEPPAGAGHHHGLRHPRPGGGAAFWPTRMAIMERGRAACSYGAAAGDLSATPRTPMWRDFSGPERHWCGRHDGSRAEDHPPRDDKEVTPPCWLICTCTRCTYSTWTAIINLEADRHHRPAEGAGRGVHHRP